MESIQQREILDQYFVLTDEYDVLPAIIQIPQKTSIVPENSQFIKDQLKRQPLIGSSNIAEVFSANFKENKKATFYKNQLQEIFSFFTPNEQLTQLRLISKDSLDIVKVFKNTEPDRWLKVYAPKDLNSLPTYLTQMFSFTNKICFVMHSDKDDKGDNLKFSLDILSSMFKSQLSTQELGIEFHCPSQVFHFLYPTLESEDYLLMNLSRKFEMNLASKITSLNFVNISFSFRDQFQRINTRKSNRGHSQVQQQLRVQNPHLIKSIRFEKCQSVQSFPFIGVPYVNLEHLEFIDCKFFRQDNEVSHQSQNSQIQNGQTIIPITHKNMTLIVKNQQKSKDQLAMLPSFEKYLGLAGYMGLLSNKTLKKVYFDFSLVKEDPYRNQDNTCNQSLNIPQFCTSYLEAYFANEATVVDHMNTYYLKNLLQIWESMGKSAKVDLEISQIQLQGQQYQDLDKNLNIWNPQEIFAHIESEYQNEFTLKLIKSTFTEKAYELIFQSNININKRLTVKIDMSQNHSKLIIV